MSKEIRFLSIAKKFEELQEEVSAIRLELNAAMNDLGIGSYAQDPDTGLVYKIVKPNGRFVFFSDLDYTRTAKPSERAGTLSKKEAEEAGFTVMKKA